MADEFKRAVTLTPMATASIRCTPRPPPSRVDLVAALLRESEMAAVLKPAAFRKPPSADGKWLWSVGAGAAWCLDGQDGPPTRRLDPARAVTRWFMRGRTGLEELLLQLYFGHLSLAEVESVAAILWGEMDGLSLLREVVPRIIERIDGWLGSPIPHDCPYVFLHSAEFRHRRTGEAAGSRVAVAVGINQLGYRETLGIVTAPLGFEGLWDSLLTAVTARRRLAPRLVVGDPEDPLMRVAVENRWGGCAFLTPGPELDRGFLNRVEPSDLAWVEKGLDELMACAKRPAGERIGARLVQKLRQAGYSALSAEFDDRLQRHLAYLELPRAHRLRLGGTNIVRAELNWVREQSRVLGPVRDERALMLLTAASLRRQGRISWNSKPFLAV